MARLLPTAFTHAPAEHLERFVGSIETTAHCWLWRGPMARAYPIFHIGGVQLRAHRLAWSWATGYPLIDGAHVHHRCRVRRCVNPAHLELVSPQTHGSRHASFFGNRARFEQDHPVESVVATCRRCGCPRYQQTVGCNSCRMRMRYRQDAEDALNEKADVA